MPDSKKNSIMRSYFSLENQLYKDKDKPVEIKSAMAWGALQIAEKCGTIEWNSVIRLYGEFMSNIMNLR